MKVDYKQAKTWIENNLHVNRFPLPHEIKEGGKYENYKVFINVSDDFYLGNSEEFTNFGKMNFFFPMGEAKESIGLQSIFGCMKLLYEIYKWNPEWKVLLHCQAGRHRSPLVKSAFYYMMLGHHEHNGNNRLLDDIKRGLLP